MLRFVPGKNTVDNNGLTVVKENTPPSSPKKRPLANKLTLGVSSHVAVAKVLFQELMPTSPDIVTPRSYPEVPRISISPVASQDFKPTTLSGYQRAFDSYRENIQKLKESAQRHLERNRVEAERQKQAEEKEKAAALEREKQAAESTAGFIKFISEVEKFSTTLIKEQEKITSQLSEIEKKVESLEPKKIAQNESFKRRREEKAMRISLKKQEQTQKSPDEKKRLKIIEKNNKVIESTPLVQLFQNPGLLKNPDASGNKRKSLNASEGPSKKHRIG